MLILMVETLLCALGAAVRGALDIDVGDRILSRLTPKITTIVLLSVACLAVGFGLRAFHLTDSLASFF